MEDMDTLHYEGEIDDWLLQKLLHRLEESGVKLDNIDKLGEFIGKTLSAALPECSKVLLTELRSRTSDTLGDWRSSRSEFEGRLRQIWGRAFDLLEMLVVIAFEAGESFNKRFRPIALLEQDYVFDILTRLHARACQVSFEILALLKSGYADGAHARWRTLYEISVVAFFVKKYGNEVAERYLLHEAIESYKAARQYEEHYKALGFEPLNKEELEEIKTVRDSLISRFGSDFKNTYGWAAEALKNKGPRFSDIICDVGLDHLRPYYKLASHNIHANPKGVTFKLGLFPKVTNLLLAGPSNAGLAEPGHGTAISICQVTTALLATRQVDFKRLLTLKVMSQLVDEIGEAFLEAHSCVEDLTLAMRK